MGKNLTEKTVVIANGNCRKRAKVVEQELMERYHFKSVVIV